MKSLKPETGCDRQQIALYLRGQLEDAELLDFLFHVESCEKCFNLLYLARRSETKGYRGGNRFEAPEINEPESESTSRKEDVKVSEEKERNWIPAWQRVADEFVEMVDAGEHLSCKTKKEFYGAVGKRLGKGLSSVQPALSEARRNGYKPLIEAYENFCKHFSSSKPAAKKAKRAKNKPKPKAVKAEDVCSGAKLKAPEQESEPAPMPKSKRISPTKETPREAVNGAGPPADATRDSQVRIHLRLLGIWRIGQPFRFLKGTDEEQRRIRRMIPFFARWAFQVEREEWWGPYDG